MNISLFIDTNTLYVKHFTNYKKLRFIENLRRLVKDISVNNFPNSITLVIPRIVVDELIQQQTESYESKIKELNKFEFPDFEVIKSADYNSFLNEQLRDDMKFINNPHVTTLIHEYPEKFEFDSIINRAIRKLPPFEGKEKESDKGFKDVIFWEMLIDYQNINANSTTILCSADRIFKSDLLKEESTKRVKSIFKVINWHSGSSEIIDLLGELFNKTTKLSLESNIIKDFKKVLYNGNLNFLFKALKFENPINEGIYEFKAVEILEMNLISDISQHDHKGNKNYYYFMVEMKLRYDFVEEGYRDSDLGNIVSTTDYFEYEILFNTENSRYYIISYDSIDNVQYLDNEFMLEENKSS